MADRVKPTREILVEHGAQHLSPAARKVIVAHVRARALVYGGNISPAVGLELLNHFEPRNVSHAITAGFAALHHKSLRGKEELRHRLYEVASGHVREFASFLTARPTLAKLGEKLGRMAQEEVKEREVESVIDTFSGRSFFELRALDALRELGVPRDIPHLAAIMSNSFRSEFEHGARDAIIAIRRRQRH